MSGVPGVGLDPRADTGDRVVGCEPGGGSDVCTKVGLLLTPAAEWCED